MYKPGWMDAERWEATRNGTGCPICLNGGPRHTIAELTTVWVSAPPKAPLPGYVCVVFKEHIIEPFDIAPPKRSAFWDEAMDVAARIASLYKPVKMNYEIHGNTVPHLHMHILPRDRLDPLGSDQRRPEVVRDPAALDAIRRVLSSLNRPWK